MKRPLVLFSAGLAIGFLFAVVALGGFFTGQMAPTPASAQAPIRWKVQSAWPPTSIVQDAAKLLVETIDKTDMEKSLAFYKDRFADASDHTFDPARGPDRRYGMRFSGPPPLSNSQPVNRFWHRCLREAPRGLCTICSPLVSVCQAFICAARARMNEFLKDFGGAARI